MVEHVADGLFDAFQCRLKQTPHRLGTESQHALRRPADVATGVLAYQTLNAAALRVIHHTALAYQYHSAPLNLTLSILSTDKYRNVLFPLLTYLPPRCTDAVSK